MQFFLGYCQVSIVSVVVVVVVFLNAHYTLKMWCGEHPDNVGLKKKKKKRIPLHMDTYVIPYSLRSPSELFGSKKKEEKKKKKKKKKKETETANEH